MKKLLKSVVCGTYEQFTRALLTKEKSKSYGWGKKKKNLKLKCASVRFPNALLEYVWIGLKTQRVCIWRFFFFFPRVCETYGYCSWTVAANFDFSCSFQPISAHCALFTDPQILLFSNFFIKNGSHGTIHTFKNYFATVFFSFQLYLNRHLVFYATQVLDFCFCQYFTDILAIKLLRLLLDFTG